MNLDALISLFWDVIFFIPLPATIVWVIIENRKLPKGQVSEEKFSVISKIGVTILCALAPIISGAIFYYTLRKKFPKKASFANLTSWIVFALEIGFVFFITSPFGLKYF